MTSFAIGTDCRRSRRGAVPCVKPRRGRLLLSRPALTLWLRHQWRRSTRHHPMQKHDKRAAEFERTKGRVDVLERQLRDTQHLLEEADVKCQARPH